MLGTPYQTKLTFLANLLTFLRILLQWKLDYDTEPGLLRQLYDWNGKELDVVTVYAPANGAGQSPA